MVDRIWFWHTKFSPCALSWRTVFVKPLDRKLHSGEAQSSWASRRQTVSWQEYFPLPENNVCLAWAARFQSVASLLAEQRGKVILWVRGQFKRSCWNTSMQVLLSTLAASGPLTLAAACTSATTALNFIALFPDGVAVFFVVWQCFFLSGNDLE